MRLWLMLLVLAVGCGDAVYDWEPIDDQTLNAQCANICTGAGRTFVTNEHGNTYQGIWCWCTCPQAGRAEYGVNLTQAMVDATTLNLARGTWGWHQQQVCN